MWNSSTLGALSAACDVTPSGRAAAAEIAPSVLVIGAVEEARASPAECVLIAAPGETPLLGLAGR